MTQQQHDRVMKIAEDNAIGIENYGEYSGRGMFGDTTLAVSFDDQDDFDEIKENYFAEHGERLRCSMDNLGKGFIAY